MSKFKIFYSWQSDLPGSKTRYFIRDCIDDAVAFAEEAEAIEAERDEATKDTTGSPNIVTTLFSKIDECDLFVADVSLCFTGDVEKEQNGQKVSKHSPNPNVLLELGYAVKTLGWERVRCICNIDFGTNFPFDFAQNRRIGYSLEGKRKADVRREVSRDIFSDVQKLKGNVPRAKAGVARHIIGTYDFEKQKVTGALVALEIGKSKSYMLHNDELLSECKELLHDIRRLTEKISKTSVDEDEIKTTIAKETGPQFPVTEKFQIQKDAIHITAALSKTNETPVVYSDKGQDAERIKKWLNTDVDDSFFDLFGLKEVTQFININGPSLSGSDDEKEKYEKLRDLSYKLELLEARTDYLKTFDGMYFIPLAIQNISEIQDSDIRIVVNVETGEAVIPSGHLICTEYEGNQELFCRDDEDEEDIGIIAELFILQEDGNIHLEECPWYPTTKMPIVTMHGLQAPAKTPEDYESELKEFIASTEGSAYYEFDVQSLRPGECRWLSTGMLIKPLNGKVAISYRIHSSHSTGDLNGKLEMICA